MSHITIVVPCYNEAERLTPLAFLGFARRNPRVRFVMVDDGSTDATSELLASLHRQAGKSITTLLLEKNCGKAEAVRRGMLAALGEMTDQQLGESPDYVGFWDADLAAPLEELPDLIRVLDERPQVQAVIGTRLPLLGREIKRRPLRRLLGRIFATAASWTLGARIYDTQCGAKLFRATQPLSDSLQSPFTAKWIFDVELLARLRRNGEPAATLDEIIYEAPLDAWREVDGSKVKATDFVRAAWELLLISFEHRGKLPPREWPAAATREPTDHESERRAA